MADDSIDNRLLVRAFLKQKNCQLDEAENGRVVQEKFKAGFYDLVLMDMRMPIVDGAAATQAIRAFESANQLPYTPIIALTASALEEDILRSHEAGCDTHVSKPVTRKALIDAIRNATRTQGPHSIVRT
jgi:CheY-like chemotaxis protein